eukprot:10683520-Alexandrium_andersonii.AAC.1
MGAIVAGVSKHLESLVAPAMQPLEDLLLDIGLSREDFEAACTDAHTKVAKERFHALSIHLEKAEAVQELLHLTKQDLPFLEEAVTLSAHANAQATRWACYKLIRKLEDSSTTEEKAAKLRENIEKMYTDNIKDPTLNAFFPADFVALVAERAKKPKRVPPAPSGEAANGSAAKRRKG